jgi:hypothetical protein
VQSSMNFISSLRDHQRWCFIGCMGVAAAVSRLPFLAEPNGNIAFGPYLTAWFACGFAAGWLVPDRPWRWGVAMAIAPPIVAIVLAPQMAFLALITIPLIPVVATPIVIGAYLGRLLSPGRTPIPTAPAARSPRLFLLFVLGLLVSSIPVFFVPKTSSDLLIVWIGTAAAIAATSVAWGRTGVLKGTGMAIGVVIGGFMTDVIYDTATGWPNHNMLPFELVYVIGVTSLPAASLALLTYWFIGRTRMRPQPQEEWEP